MEQDAVGVALLAVVVVDGFVGEGEVHLTRVAKLIEFLLGGFEHERANLVVLVEGVVGLLDGGSLFGKLSLGNLLVLQLLGESLDAVSHVTVVVDAEEGTKLLVVEGLALLVVAVEREENVDTRCALLLTDLCDAGDVHGVATGHREEVVDVVLIHLDTDLSRGAGAGNVFAVTLHEVVGNVHRDIVEQHTHLVGSGLAPVLDIAELHAHELFESLFEFGVSLGGNS